MLPTIKTSSTMFLNSGTVSFSEVLPQSRKIRQTHPGKRFNMTGNSEHQAFTRFEQLLADKLSSEDFQNFLNLSSTFTPSKDLNPEGKFSFLSYFPNGVEHA